MQKAQPMARTPQDQFGLLATETRQFTDVCEMNEAYRGRADVRFMQTAPGGAAATSRLTSIGPVQIQQISWTGKLITEAATASNRTTLIIPEPRERPAFICGEHLNAAQIMLYGPSSEHFSEMSGRSRATQLFLPEGILEQAIAARLQNDPMNLASKRRLLTPGSDAMHSLRQLIVELTQIIDNDENAGVEPVCTSSLMKNLVDRIAEALCRDSSLASMANDQLHASGYLLSRVKDIFNASGRESIHLYELCKELGVSARTLQIAFKQAYGISPMRYLKLRRLHAVRQRLITSSVDDVSIKRAALEGGFVDRSRLAEDFRKLFGHLPSQAPRA
ncbi:Virulence regulon transcriptional activator VirF [Stieleria varia]|uniref:Virulence regulon transcriptional activator VirF n=3 Tax=Stieleria varia TaxID=2528005 RepID=A0A5C6B972_9BACT|nr:Virulence regulon transcriptional activator VirF [Stieleria varia]